MCSPENGMWALTTRWPETRRVLGHGKDRSHPAELLRSIMALIKPDFLDWDTVLSVGPQGMGWRTDHILVLFVLLSSRSFSSLVVVLASKYSPALIYHRSLSKMRNSLIIPYHSQRMSSSLPPLALESSLSWFLFTLLFFLATLGRSELTLPVI